MALHGYAAAAVFLFLLLVIESTGGWTLQPCFVGVSWRGVVSSLHIGVGENIELQTNTSATSHDLDPLSQHKALSKGLIVGASIVSISLPSSSALILLRIFEDCYHR